MKRSTLFGVVALIQFIMACQLARRWVREDDGVALAMAIAAALTAILVTYRAYSVRNEDRSLRWDPRLLRAIMKVGLGVGLPALAVMLWRVGGEWGLLGEPANLMLALLWIFGLGYGGFAALLLRDSGRPESTQNSK